MLPLYDSGMSQPDAGGTGSETPPGGAHGGGVVDFHRSEETQVDKVKNKVYPESRIADVIQPGGHEREKRYSGTIRLPPTEVWAAAAVLVLCMS